MPHAFCGYGAAAGFQTSKDVMNLAAADSGALESRRNRGEIELKRPEIHGKRLVSLRFGPLRGLLERFRSGHFGLHVRICSSQLSRILKQEPDRAKAGVSMPKSGRNARKTGRERRFVEDFRGFGPPRRC